ncbi:hypothetical protein [Corynebacterium aquilae]|uniref:hypothetical protein n=1 Tax=Corynebacterium aquilae TaxID=203263 RepID=UPI0009511A1F|nr:hypothetical protein [Corynebacterium aquilae]
MIAILAGVGVAAIGGVLLWLERHNHQHTTPTDTPRPDQTVHTPPEPPIAQEDPTDDWFEALADDAPETTPVTYEDEPKLPTVGELTHATEPTPTQAPEPTAGPSSEPTAVDIDDDVESSLGDVPVYRTLAHPTEPADTTETVDPTEPADNDDTPAPAESAHSTDSGTDDTADSGTVDSADTIAANDTTAQSASSETPAEGIPGTPDVDHPTGEDHAIAGATEEELADTAGEPAPTAETSTETATSAPAEEEPAHSKLHPLIKALPGGARRERKAWAEVNDFVYDKQDEYLADEWSRGPATLPSTAHDIVSGVACGYDMHVVDLGGSTLLALRRAAASDALVEFTRASAPVSEDLIPGPSLGDFTMSCSEEVAVDRLVDARLRTAISNMPEAVEMVWAESDWVVASLDRHSNPTDWDDALAPLAMVADVMHALPARGILAHWPTDIVTDPTRALPQPVMLEEDSESPEPEEPSRPQVVRPEVAPELPSRAVGTSLGHVPLTDIGADELDAIADKMTPPASAGFNGSRLVRNQPLDSSIFHDASDGEDGQSD